MTPVLTAISTRNSKCLRILIEAGANLNVKAMRGFSAVHIAVTSSAKICLQILIEHGCDLNRLNVRGKCPLLLALQRSNKELATMLITNGCAFESHAENEIVQEILSHQAACRTALYSALETRDQHIPTAISQSLADFAFV